jgi:biotin operon repressor
VLKVLLAKRDYTTAAELAGELGVTVRTVQRDLAFLRDLGMPVDSDRGRGGGLRLEHGWSLGRVHLSETEAIGLLLGLTIAEKVGSPLLLDDARSIARKIAASFAPAQARRILVIRRRIRRRPVLLRSAERKGHQAPARCLREQAGRHHQLPRPACPGHCAGDRASVPLLQRPRLVRARLGPTARRRPLFQDRPHQEGSTAFGDLPTSTRREVSRGR